MIVARSKPESRTLLAPILAALVLFPLFVTPSPARADEDCLQMYVNCVEAASDLDGVPRRSWAGLRSASNLLACLQHRLA